MVSNSQPSVRVETPLFESLESRLLLTTLHGGDAFIYHNSQGNQILISVSGGSDTTVEFFAHDAATGGPAKDTLIDLVGLVSRGGGAWDDTTFVMANAGSTGTYDSSVLYHPPTGNPTWLEYQDPLITDPAQQALTRGSRTEIFAIYVASATPTSVLTISQLASDTYGVPQNGWDTDIDPWLSSTLPLIPGGNPYINAPAGSGAVVVGASFVDLTNATPPVPIFAVSSNVSLAYTVDSRPGYVDPATQCPDNVLLHAGINVLETQYQTIDLAGSLGADVQAVAATGVGNANAVNEALVPTVVNYTNKVGAVTDAQLGDVVTNLATNGTGDFYTINQDRYATDYSPALPAGFIGAGGTGVLGVNAAGVFFSYNQTNRHLYSIDPGTLATTDLGLVQSGATASWQYLNLTGLDLRPGANQFYAVANVLATVPTDPAPATPGQARVIAIDPNTGTVMSESVLPLGVAINSLAWNSTGTVLYGTQTVGAVQSVCTIDTSGATAVITTLGALTDSGTANPITTPMRIEAIGNTLYGVTTTSATNPVDPTTILYRIDPLTGICTNLGNITIINPATGATRVMTGATDLAFDINNAGYMYTIDATTRQLSRVVLAPRLETFKDTGDNHAIVGSLLNSANLLQNFGAATALTYYNGTFYGVGRLTSLDPVGSPAPAATYLFRVDPATGLATILGPCRVGAVQVNVVSVAVDSTGAMVGVSDANMLYQVNSGTGALTVVGALTAPEPIVTLSFGQIGGNDVLYGTSVENLYAINPATGDSTLLCDTGRTDLQALAFSAVPVAPLLTVPTLWTLVDSSGSYRLERLDLAATLKQADAGLATLAVSTVGAVYDSVNPSWTYTDVTALSYDASGVLYGVGKPVNLDPYHTADPVAGNYLLTIDPATGLATAVTPITDTVGASIDTISTLAFHGGTLFAVNADDPAANELVTINLATGVATNIGVIQPGYDDPNDNPDLGIIPVDVVGMDFVGGTLYAVDAGSLFTINPATGEASLVADLNLPGVNLLHGRPLPVTLSGLTAVPGQPDFLYASAFWGDHYTLLRVLPDISKSTVDFGRIIIGGTIAGQVTTLGSIDVLEMGFLWGDIDIGKNTQAIISHAGMGGTQGPIVPNVPSSSTINVGGTLSMLDDRAGWVFSSVVAQNLPTVPTVDPTFNEFEVGTNDWTAAARDYEWTQGEMIDTYYDNNSMAHAQFLTQSTGAFSLYGSLVSEDASFTANGKSVASDWYGLPLMAGQTLTLDGTTSIGSFLLNGNVKVHLYNSAGEWMGSLGYESMEDGGVGSRGTTQKPMTFTAPEAGVYYVVVIANPGPLPGKSYRLDFNGATAANIGGINIDGSYQAVFGGPNIEVQNGGNFGAFVATGVSRNTWIQTTGGGNLVTFQAGSIGEVVGGLYRYNNSIVSSGDIGRVATTTGDLFGDITAGGLLHQDARIQNVYVAGDYYYSASLPPVVLSATGSIGMVEVMGDIGLVAMTANSDAAGPAGDIDLVRVHGNWGMYTAPNAPAGIPQLRHGPGGNVGYVEVDGTIWVDYGTYKAPLRETLVSDGHASSLRDDGGGTLTVTPQVSQVVDPVTGKTTSVMATYSYGYIGVDDTVGGVGGVIANLRINGSANLTATGSSQIVNLDLSTAGPATKISIGGTGETSIYYLQGNTANPLSFDSFTNSTKGNLLSGSIAGANTISIGGDLGDMLGHTGTLLAGRNLAPVTGDKTLEPQFGWYHNSINGLNVAGSIGALSVGGALGDLRVTGKVGSIRVNSDNTTAVGHWDGVNGLVWVQGGATSMALGNGLADDGDVDRARAAIMADAPITAITISGPRYVRDGLVYNEINGAILVNFPAYPVTVDAIGSVTGTGGATDTAIIAGITLNAYQPFAGFFGDMVRSSGSVGTVSFSGSCDPAGSPGLINGGEVFGYFVRTVSGTPSTADLYGISNSYISGDHPNPNQVVVGQVTGGGLGVAFDIISANGGDLGNVAAIGPVGDVHDTTLISTDGMKSLSGRDIYNMGVHMPGTIWAISATRDMYGNNLGSTQALVGSIGKITVGRDFFDNVLTVADTIGTIGITGQYRDSFIILQGPTTADLTSLTVGGDILASSPGSSGIFSSGHLGSIISTNGSISADIRTESGGWNNDINLIQMAGDFTGTVTSAGALKKFVTGGDLGINPATVGGAVQIVSVAGDLGTVQVGSTKTGAPLANLYADISTGGNIGTIAVTGVDYGNIGSNGNLGTLTVGGDLGGDLGGGVGFRGNVNVLGSIGTISVAANSDILGAINAGSDIGSIKMAGGSIRNDVLSSFGTIKNISLTNGSLLGDVAGAAIGTISVTNGDIGALAGGGNITATNGKIASLTLTGGNLGGGLFGNVKAENGTIDILKLISATTLAGKTISATGGIGAVTLQGTALLADMDSGRDIKTLTVTKGGSLRSNIHTALGLGTATITGDLNGASINSDTTLGTITVTGNVLNSTIAALSNLGTTKVTGNVTNSFFLAGYGVGDDGVVGGGDDVGPHAGSIKSLTVTTGTMTGSVVAAGMGPGLDGDFLAMADNTKADGLSNITALSVKGGFGADWSTSGVLAETAIDPAFIKALPVGNTLKVYQGTPVPLVGVGAVNFGPQTGTNKYTTPDGLSMTLTGVKAATANYDAATGHIVLNGTTSTSTLTLTYTGVGFYGTDITIEGADDASLGALTFTGKINVGTLDFDGSVASVTATNVVNTSDWTFSGGVGTVKVGDVGNLDVTAASSGAWTFTGGYASGNFNVDDLTSMTLKGALGANVTVALGNIGSLVTNDLTGDVEVNNTLTTLTVNHDLTGAVVVDQGDLTTMTVAGNFTGSVEVAGAVKTAKVIGDFGGLADTSFRAGTGITSFTVTKGDFLGLLYTDGAMGTFTVNGDMSGRAYADGITTVTMTNMIDGLLSSGGNITTTTISGKMTDSYLMAGFNPGDAGYDMANGGEGANLVIDAFTAPWAVNVNNADKLGSGDIGTVTIGGNMTTSAISAGVGPGLDGYMGTGDEQAAGTGRVTKVTVKGDIAGSVVDGEGYGVFASSNTPTVTSYGQPFQVNGNAWVGTVAGVQGPLLITGVSVSGTTITVSFNHSVNSSTIDDASVYIVASTDLVFGNPDDVNITTAPGINHTLVYDIGANSVTFSLTGSETWENLGQGDYYQITISGAITDSRAVQLDGEYTGSFPTGNGVAGGDFQDVFSFAGVDMSQNATGPFAGGAYVPAYLWYNGCVPTSGAMILGYYDQMPAYNSLLTGDPTPLGAPDPLTGTNMPGNVADLIASPGHIADYALYNGYDDSADLIPYPDMSSLDPSGAHADDSLADFMLTSRSAEGLTYGGTYGGDDANGMDAFITYRLHSANVSYALFGATLTLDSYMYEINHGRPVMLGVDSDGDGLMDHEVAGVGYKFDDASGQWQYLALNTWDTTVHAYQWQAANTTTSFGIGDGVLVQMVA